MDKKDKLFNFCLGYKQVKMEFFMSEVNLTYFKITEFGLQCLTHS